MKRVVVAAGFGITAVALQASPALAHGIGGREDLPVPLPFFIVGAGIAIVISFVVLSVNWNTPRLQDGPDERPSRLSWLAGAMPWLAVVGVVGFGLVLLGGLIDGQESRNNIAPVLVWVYFWLVVPFASVLVGDVWRWMSPWRLMARWVNRDRPERSDLLTDFGMWPAAIVFVAITWLELVSPDAGFPRTLALAAIVYTVYKLVLTAVAGVDTGHLIGGGFSNYTRLIGAIAPIEVRTQRASVGAATLTETRTVVHRGWLRALPVLQEQKGLSVFVVAMIGTVTYDGVSATSWWSDLVGSLQRETWFGTVTLVGTVAVVGLAYYAASAVAAKMASEEGSAPNSASAVASRFAHTLVPIGFAYAFAHYVTLIIYEGQLLIRTASDPFGLGWDLFGTADWVTACCLPATIIWYVQVLAIVGGHIAGVMLAHDRALADFGKRVAVRSQYAMLVLMVFLTSLGLLILAG